ncbi:hypothetical protein CEXT_37971 [Caerostris extrusa]|uniref:Uncharacterized protein n=1 Tax=Caerostris extrusa TaxID=172846 RepID=A0AAV4TW21_CAEEX|nr:hypothetical protein CEXT_37971 [Caerostris extrusa]
MFGNYLFILCMLVSTCKCPASSTIDAIEGRTFATSGLASCPPKLELKNPGYRRKPFNFGFNYKFCEMFLCPGFTITKLKKCAEGKRYDPFLRSAGHYSVEDGPIYFFY